MKEEIEKIVIPLLLWYEKNKRELPWREENPNPYHVWLSEIMLQQTRIEAVKRYYARFIQNLPTIEDLANIEEEKLLKLWEGLGYYNRARNLKKAAQVMVKEYHAKMPVHYEELLKLPGIGEYTAGAIASICFGEKVPAVDGNVMRVVSRIIASRENVLLPETKKKITEWLKACMPEKAGAFNEALMELGETICLPNGEPLCENCPIQKMCKAYQNHMTKQIPVREKEKRRKIEEKTVLVIAYEDEIAIQKRENEGMLAGMYQFPNVDEKWEEDKISNLLERWQLKLDNLVKKQHYRHIFTHKEWDMVGYYITVKNKNKDWLWVKETELKETYAMPTAFKEFQKMIEK